MSGAVSFVNGTVYSANLKYAVLAGLEPQQVTIRALAVLGTGILLIASSNWLEPSKHSGPSKAVRHASIAISLWSVCFCIYSGLYRWKEVRESDWPEWFGLFCGLASVAVAQIGLVTYQFIRRKTSPIAEWSIEEKIQTKDTLYERGFFNDVIYHLSNPGAFILMLPYLCLTWMLCLMPDSYYEYDPSVNWWNVLLQLLVVDLFTFTFHVAEHSVPAFYKSSHKPHHRFTNPHLFNAFDGSLLDTIALILFPLFTTAQLLHVNNWDYVAFGTVYSTHFMMIHSEYRHFLDPVLRNLFVNVCEDHHVHHAVFNSNFSHFFTIFDRLAGTYRSGATIKGFTTFSKKVKVQ